MKNSNSGDAMKVVGALVLGAAAGATLGVLFAPNKGSKTRENIAGGAKTISKNLKQKFQGELDALKKRASKEVKDFKKQASETEKLVENRVIDAKSNLEHKFSNAVETSKS